MSQPDLVDLVNEVTAVFGPDGVLAQHIPAYVLRNGQLEMAQAVARTVQDGGVLVAEAGTGIGKSFAYLVPALLGGQRTLVSTATKALQDQLYSRDIPELLRMLALPLRVALLKGRGSYLCAHRLDLAQSIEGSKHPDVHRDLAAVVQWSTVTVSGDMAELEALEEASPVLPLVTSTRENCLGAQCPRIAACHVNRARRLAMDADLIVGNHHLFFADLNVRESGVAELLPTCHTVVLDEAHHLSAIGIQFLGQTCSSNTLLSLARDLLQDASLHAPLVADWHGLAMDMVASVHAVQRACGPQPAASRLRWDAETPESVDAALWSAAWESLCRVVDNASAALDLVAQSAPTLAALLRRCQTLQEAMTCLQQPVPTQWARWLEVDTAFRIVECPLSLVQAFGSSGLDLGHARERNRAWIFTSATLGNGRNVDWFLQSCGLEHAQVLRVDSPFDYASQSSLYIPEFFPRPADPNHSAELAKLVGPAAQILGGRTLVLTTTLRAMKAVAALLRRHLESNPHLEVLVQGQSPKRALLQRFVQAGSGRQAKGCVLVASVSFWEGVDIPGSALQLLVIDKLPFPPPDDPLVQSKAQAIEREGKSAFKELHLPMTAVALRQGAGRLIRRETDRGILVVCDVRLLQMGYGRALIKSLPNMHRLSDETAFQLALVELTKASTTASL